MSKGNGRFSGNGLYRREVLRLAGLAPALPVADLLSSIPFGKDHPVSGPGQVVKVHMPGMRGRLVPHPDAARIMVQTAITTLTGDGDPVSAWTRLVRPTDRVGIKVNLVGGRLSGTSFAVVDAIVEALLTIIPPQSITIFDQFETNFHVAGYDPEKTPHGVRMAHNGVAGYEDTPISVPGAAVKLAKIFTACDAIINVPVIKDHGLAGVTCALKNLVYGIVENPRAIHGNLHEVLPLIYGHEAVRSRARLTVVDGSFCLFDGGPRHNPDAHVTHDSIYATVDPVAMDAVAAELIDTLRKENGLRSLTESSRPAQYLELAARLGLGIADRSRIQLKTVELPRFSGSAA